MKITAYVLFLITLSGTLAGCATTTVRQQDLDAWKGVPVEALDTHSFFLTIPMVKTLTASGIEIRNYANGADVSQCFGSSTGYGSTGYVNANAFTACSTNRVVCNNIFYIREGKVVEYAPTGRCKTAEMLQPEARYKSMVPQ